MSCKVLDLGFPRHNKMPADNPHKTPTVQYHKTATKTTTALQYHKTTTKTTTALQYHKTTTKGPTTTKEDNPATPFLPKAATRATEARLRAPLLTTAAGVVAAGPVAAAVGVPLPPTGVVWVEAVVLAGTLQVLVVVDPQEVVEIVEGTPVVKEREQGCSSFHPLLLLMLLFLMLLLRLLLTQDTIKVGAASAVLHPISFQLLPA